MDITEVRIKLMDEAQERLKAFCSITFDDCFVVRDLKIIEGSNGPFVAMPSRKLTSHCGKCGMKNHLRANHCNQCGARLEEGRLIKDADGRAKLYADIAHPINAACREMIQQHVIHEYDREIERASQPGYVSRYDDLDGDDFVEDLEARRFDSSHESRAAGRPHRPPAGDPLPGASVAGPHNRPHNSSLSEARERSPARRSDTGFGSGVFDK